MPRRPRRNPRGGPDPTLPHQQLLFEARGKLRAHSGTVWRAFSCNFLGRKFDQTNEPVSHATLGETEEMGVDDGKVEILGKRGS